MDWKNCAHHACSEIRDNHLSGDCHYKRELLPGFMKIRGHEQVWRTTHLSSSTVALTGTTAPTCLLREASLLPLCRLVEAGADERDPVKWWDTDRVHAKMP
uniref:Mitochondrial inner membrane protease ATP23 n=1 Tax=Oryza punctata TaxID=4537 RepID=A0A0E0MLG6_ORYPU